MMRLTIARNQLEVQNSRPLFRDWLLVIMAKRSADGDEQDETTRVYGLGFNV